MPDQTRAPLLRRYWINPGFQSRVILSLLIIAIIVIGATSALLNYYFHDFIQMGVAAGLQDGNVFFQFIEKQKSLMNQLFAGLALGLFVLITLFGMVLSHRVAGPLHRLRLHMESVAAGKAVTPVKFRDKDFFPELAAAYNRQLEYLAQRGPRASEDDHAKH